MKLNIEEIKPARVQETDAGAKSYTGRSEFIKHLIDETPGLKSNLEGKDKDVRKGAFLLVRDAVKARYPQNASPVHIEETIKAYLKRLEKASAAPAEARESKPKASSSKKRGTKPATAKRTRKSTAKPAGKEDLSKELEVALAQ